MTRFFKFFWIILSICPAFLIGQTDWSVHAIGLSPSDSLFVQRNFQLLPKDYTYVVVHGYGNTFKILEGSSWNTLTELSLAQRIANKVTDSKPIVLLSCSDTTTSQNLANALAKLDTNAMPKRAMRPVIGWDGDVVLFENGTIQGYGACRFFSAALAGQKIPTARILTEPAIPSGTNQPLSPSMVSVTLARPLSPEGKKIDALRVNGQPLPTEQRNALLDAWRDTKVDFINTYYENTNIIIPTPLQKPKGIIQNLATLFDGWLFLKYDCSIKPTPITGDYDVLVSAQVISTKLFYQQNTQNVQSLFKDYLKDGKNPTTTLPKLGDATSVNDFITVIQQAGKRTPLTALWGTTSLSDWEKNLQILNTVPAQIPFVTLMRAYRTDPTRVPAQTPGMTLNLLQALTTALSQNLIKNRNFLEDALPLITPVVNKTIGTNCNYTQLLQLTQTGGVVEHSKGSIFEHWGFKQHNEVVYAKSKKYELGQALIRKNPLNMEMPSSVLVDFHYKILEKSIVAVEFKYAKTLPSAQLKARKKLLEGQSAIVLNYIYIFAEKPIADTNAPNNLSKAPVVVQLLQELGALTQIYYYNATGVLTKI